MWNRNKNLGEGCSFIPGILKRLFDLFFPAWSLFSTAVPAELTFRARIGLKSPPLPIPLATHSFQPRPLGSFHGLTLPLEKSRRPLAVTLDCLSVLTLSQKGEAGESLEVEVGQILLVKLEVLAVRCWLILQKLCQLRAKLNALCSSSQPNLPSAFFP